MWRTEGQGELYTYLPSSENPGFDANKILCDVAPMSECNPTYGASVGRGAFDFKSGQWNTVSQRVRLNDVGKSNGELELFFNGKSVINVSGLKFRNNAQGRFRGIQAQTFFGGKPFVAHCFAVHISHLVPYRFHDQIRFTKGPEHLVLRLLRRHSQDPLKSSIAAYDLRQQTPNNSHSLCMCFMAHLYARTHSLRPSLSFICTSLAFLIKWAVL